MLRPCPVAQRFDESLLTGRALIKLTIFTYFFLRVFKVSFSSSEMFAHQCLSVYHAVKHYAVGCILLQKAVEALIFLIIKAAQSVKHATKLL